jgi:predicted RNA binding protein YcfA (HicA-like mRNA interferase family)
MTQRLPALRPHQVLRALEKAGWQVHRQRGSHVSMHKEGVPFLITVPLHRRDLPRGTLRDIIKDAGLTVEELLELL